MNWSNYTSLVIAILITGYFFGVFWVISALNRADKKEQEDAAGLSRLEVGGLKVLIALLWPITGILGVIISNKRNKEN